MHIEHVRDTAKMRVYSVDGTEVQTTHGSMLESVLRQIRTLDKPYLTSMDLKGDPMRVSGALRALVNRGALARSPGILSVRGNERFYLYFSLTNQPIQGHLIEAFLEENSPDPRIVEIFRRVKYGGEVLSNYDIRAEFGAIDLVQLQNYIRNALLGERYVKRHGSSYIDATFWYPAGMPAGTVDQAVKEKLDSSILKRKEAIDKGRAFENSLYAAFGEMFAAQSLQFSIFDHNKQVRKQLAGGRLRIFDMVAYAAPVLVDGGGHQKPLKWFHGSIKLVFEFKYNFRVTKGFLAEYYMDVREAYGDLAVPVVVAGGDPGYGAVYDSGWQFAKHHNGVWLITGSSLTQVLRGGAPSLASQAHEGEAHEHENKQRIHHTECIPYGSDEHDCGGPLTAWLATDRTDSNPDRA